MWRAGHRYVHVEALCTTIGLDVIDDPKLSSRAEIRMYPSRTADGTFEVRVNTDQPSYQRRFSLAHETGIGACIRDGSMSVLPWKNELATTSQGTFSCPTFSLMSGSTT